MVALFLAVSCGSPVPGGVDGIYGAKLCPLQMEGGPKDLSTSNLPGKLRRGLPIEKMQQQNTSLVTSPLRGCGF